VGKHEELTGIWFSVGIETRGGREGGCRHAGPRGGGGEVCSSEVGVWGCGLAAQGGAVGGGDKRLSPDLPRGTVNLIGGELDVDDLRLRTNRTSRSLHYCSVGYHPCHTNDFTTKVYPCKRNQEHKQE
jgi:hypothetical protein